MPEDTRKLKVVALISGGKDSCYNMMKCVQDGHEIVALAHLKPKVKEELDSYMYQSVGHNAIGLYAEAMGLPLYQQDIEGTAINKEFEYTPTVGDEVEDLLQLLLRIRKDVEFNAISVGAIFSDYQRVRCVNVCERLGNVEMLAYLWHREQGALLKEMIDSGVNAIIIKVAAMGLEPKKHLGSTLAEIYPHTIAMEKQFGLNVCGEGGEFESFTVDCPLFKRRIVIDNMENVMHSDDAFAPVGFIKFNKMHLEDKE